ncbi:MAG: DegV family protein [Chloroflexota bacterium]
MTMPSIAIVTDSMARFTAPGALNGQPVTIAPVLIRSGRHVVEDTLDMDLQMLFDGADGTRYVPLAIPPSTESLSEIYNRLQREADRILSIHTSSRLAATFANARQASQQFLGRCDIQVIDSQSISVGLGLLVEAAAKAATRGESFDEIVRIVRGMIPRLYMVFFLEQLDYLERLGRLSRSQAILGNMLGIIPFLTLEEGDVIPMEKVRSRPRAVEKLVEFVSEFSNIQHLAILQSEPRPTEESRQIAERLQALNPTTPITINCYGASVATCIGPDSLGVVVLESGEEVA